MQRKAALKAEGKRWPEGRLRLFGTTARCMTLGVIREAFPQVNDLAGEPGPARRQKLSRPEEQSKESFVLVVVEVGPVRAGDSPTRGVYPHRHGAARTSSKTLWKTQWKACAIRREGSIACPGKMRGKPGRTFTLP